MELRNYLDLMNKLEYDLEKYSKNNNIYEFFNCLMTLNAIPEWIRNSDNSSSKLKEFANEKLSNIIANKNFKLDYNLLESEIDHKLRFIRLTCNHLKHRNNNKEIPLIKSQYGGMLPATFPIKLYNIIAIGEKSFDAEFILLDVAKFWKRIISEN